METMAQMPVWAMILINVLTLIMGGGAAWAYFTRRHETDAARVARYEGRIDTRLEAVEKDRDQLRAQLSDLTTKLALALRDLKEAREDLVGHGEELEAADQECELRRERELRLVELLLKHGAQIPPELLVPIRRRRTTGGSYALGEEVAS